MIPYVKREWTSHLFDIEGSMVREITGRVAACVAWCVAVVVIHKTVFEFQVSPTVHTLVGVALGLLLVFRTNASYDRYWEGRRQWGSIINESRNLARGTWVHLRRGAPDLAEQIGLWTVTFAHATKDALKKLEGIGPLKDRLPPQEVEAVLANTHSPTAAAARITERLAEARDRGVISDYIMVTLDANVQQLIDYLGACERILKTPLPFVYVVHLRRALILYCFTLPFILTQLYGWGTIPITMLVAYMFFGIEEIGVEIENPFGDDANDLPLEQFCQTIENDVMSLLGPEGLALPALVDARPIILEV